jgi:flavin reductase (DIM6/NTAB) family NADH-FMN oxidoreductase RutF
VDNVGALCQIGRSDGGWDDRIVSAVNKILDSRQLRNAYGHFPTGVTALCAFREGHPVGMAASSFVPVSLDPPLVSVCVNNTSRTWPTLSCLFRLGVSELAESQDGTCRQLAATTGDRFAGLEWEATREGRYLLREPRSGSTAGFMIGFRRGIM